MEPGYLVPRGDGRYVLGATMEERGYDTTPPPAASTSCCATLTELVPGISELEIEELKAGLRPGHARQRARARRRARCDGLHWAAGHHRNGILLAPVTADLVRRR